jgi:chemotaxis signal transduction protein
MSATLDPISSPASARSSATSVGRSSVSTDHRAAGVCAFDLPGGRFGLDVAMVGEVVPVERAVHAAPTPRGVLGLFNLRGAAVALIDLTVVLDMPGSGPVVTATPLALVVRAGSTILAAIQVTAVITVIAPSAATMVAADRQVDHPAIAGFVTTASTGVVSVLDNAVVHQRLATLRSR